jgi:acetyl-CoA carboxylase biotin carboxyl carrier protein
MPSSIMETRRLNLSDLRDLLQLLDEKEISEFELEQEGMKLRIRKGGVGHPPAVPVLAPLMPAVAPGLAAYPPAGAPAATTATAAADEPSPEPADDGILVKSPIVGTFYRSPDPNSPVFVNVGDRVKTGQVLCIIEAMKLMNEIEAEVEGELVKIHHENGQPVQYGDPLFTIRPSR